MPRYRLRTLLIVLALGPLLLAGGWWAWTWYADFRAWQKEVDASLREHRPF